MKKIKFVAETPESAYTVIKEFPDDASDEAITPVFLAWVEDEIGCYWVGAE